MQSLAEIPDLSDFDTFVHGFPHDAFRLLREQAPVWWHEPTSRTPDGEGFWNVSTHELVMEVFRRPAEFSSHTGGDRPYGGTTLDDIAMAGKLLNMMDDPRHQRIRQLVNAGFTPKRIRGLREELEGRARAILDAVDPGPGNRGHCDLVVDVAAELPLQAICMLLGVPQHDRGPLCGWVDVVADYDGREYGEYTDELVEAAANLAAYGQDLIARRTAEPGDDLLSLVIHGELPNQDPPRLDADEVAMFWSLLFVAGAETTRKAIAGGIWALTEEPCQLAELRADRSLMPAAVEETVRWTTPSVYKRRTATVPVELGGRQIEPGQKVLVWEMSANRDNSVFDRPDRFDITRDPNPHVGFGHGPHYCLGANLARLEIDVMFDAILDRWADIEVVGEPEYTRTNRLAGLKRLPVAFTST